MQILRTPRDNGKLLHLSAPRLAKAIDRTGQLSDGAINSCIHTLRAGITETMLANANLTVGRDDVIANLGRGYHLADWLIIEAHDSDAQPCDKQSSSKLDAEISHHPEGPPAGYQEIKNPLTDRQYWVLDQLRDNVKLTRAMVERQFSIGPKQTKRELSGLSGRGLIQFIRKPRPGYYALRSKPSAKTSIAYPFACT